MRWILKMKNKNFVSNNFSTHWHKSKGVGWGSKMSALMCAQVSKNDHINGKIQLLFNNGMSVLKDSGIKGIKGRATFS